MESNRFLKITIIVLVLVNISTLAFMWSGRKHHEGHMPPPHGPNGAFDFLTHELNLDESQIKQFDALRKEHHEEAMIIQEKSRKMHHRFFDLLKNMPADSLVSAQLADSMAMCQKQMEMLTFNHFKKVRDICKPEQQKKFDEVINEALEMMAPHPPKGPRGPEGPPPPPEH
jgi:periplasmic protein CpxP/Spy